MGFLDNAGLAHLWGKFTAKLGLKMDKATYDPQGRAEDVFAYADAKTDELPIKSLVGTSELPINLDEIYDVGIYYISGVIVDGTDRGNEISELLNCGYPLVVSRRSSKHVAVQKIYLFGQDSALYRYAIYPNTWGEDWMDVTIGDMAYSIYDIQGKKQDIFLYTDAAVQGVSAEVLDALPIKKLVGTEAAPIDIDTLVMPGTYYLSGNLLEKSDQSWGDVSFALKHGTPLLVTTTDIGLPRQSLTENAELLCLAQRTCDLEGIWTEFIVDYYLGGEIIGELLDAKADKALLATAVLHAAAWTGTAAPYTQIVSVSGVTANNAVTPSPAPASWEAAGQAGVHCTAQAAGSLTFTCSTIPTVDLTYNVLIQEVQ